MLRRGVATFDLARLLKNRGPERAAEAEALFQEVREMYADVDNHRPGGLGKWSEAELYALHNLIVGKVAPEIEDRDGEGKAFKLSDYRGKVVLLAVLDRSGNVSQRARTDQTPGRKTVCSIRRL